MDWVISINELVDLAKKSENSCFIFKVDFKKLMTRLVGILWIICSLDLVLMIDKLDSRALTKKSISEEG